MASHFLCVPLTYSNPLLAGAISLQAAASAAPPDLCPSSRTSTLLTKAEQHRTKAPRLLWRCLYDIYPFLHRPSPSGQRGQGRGEGCQPPYSIWSSSFRSCVLSLKFYLIFYYIAIISKLFKNVKTIRIFFLPFHRRWRRQYYIHTLSSGCEIMA